MSRLKSPRLVGAAFAILGLTALVVVFNPPQNPWARPLHIRLEAGAFGELPAAASVEIGGVRVGQVSGLSYDQGRAVVDLNVDNRYAHLLHESAGARIRPYGLLGPKHIELLPGEGAQMKAGATIPISRVTVATDVDQVLNSLQPDVRESLRTVFVELGNAADGRGADMNAALQALGGATSDLTIATDVLRARSGDIADFITYSEILNRDLQNAPIDANIRDTNTVLSGLVQVEASIGGTIDHTAGVTRSLNIAFDGNSQNLAEILKRAPITVDKLKTALVSGQTIVDGVNPSLPSLMTAAVYTESAFAYRDADGHYVHILGITGPCTVSGPPNPSCAGNVGNPSSPPRGGYTEKGPTTDNPLTGGQLSNQQIISALMTPSPSPSASPAP